MVGALVVPSIAAGQQNPDESCRHPIPNATPLEPADAVDPPVVLQADPRTASQVVNFGADRAPESRIFHVTVQAPDDVVPQDLTPKLEVVPDQMLRTGEKTDSVAFPRPRWGDIRTSRNGRQLSFRVCLQPPQNLPAGQYVSIITLEGPPGVESGSRR